MKATSKEHLLQIIRDCISLHGTNCDLNHIDLSEITDLSELFFNSDFNGDISKWNTSNVKSMRYMFCSSAFNGNISNWNVYKVEDTSWMFYDSDFNGDISKWNLYHLQHQALMFDAKFKGVCPTSLLDKLYFILDSRTEIDQFLNNHKYVLSRIHVIRAIELKNKPNYVSVLDFKKIKQIQRIGEQLGLPKKDIIQQVMTSMNKPSYSLIDYDNFVN